MIIFFKTDKGNTKPIVIVDYTRSDEQYNQTEIKKEVMKAGKTLGKQPNILNLETFSLNYRLTYNHSGVNPSSSLKTTCTIEIDNAPSILVNLINIKQYTKQQSALSLESAVKDIIDPQVSFPAVAIVLRNGSNTNKNPSIMRNLIVYSTGFNFSDRQSTSSLVLNCASMSSMVIGLNFAVNVQTTKPLVTQIKSVFASSKYTFTVDASLKSLKPKVEKYYAPATMNNILSEIAIDYGLFIDIDDDKKTINIKSLNPKDKPKATMMKTFCFRGMVPNAKIISNFSVQDYSTAVFETEIEDIKIFDSILIYDDSKANKNFENFIEYKIPYKNIKAYQFYLQEYHYSDSRIQTTLKMVASNNWVVSNFKLGAFLEGAIYKDALK